MIDWKETVLTEPPLAAQCSGEFTERQINEKGRLNIEKYPFVLGLLNNWSNWWQKQSFVEKRTETASFVKKKNIYVLRIMKRRCELRVKKATPHYISVVGLRMRWTRRTTIWSKGFYLWGKYNWRSVCLCAGIIWLTKW